MTDSSLFKHRKKRALVAPVMINLEITSGCNLKCRHCYNFWRQDSAPIDKLEMEKIERLLQMAADEGVFHVVLTGGEPFSNFNILEHALKRCTELGLSTSVNSNLMLTSDDKMKRLASAGLDHVLTSVYSYKPENNDFMMNRAGALEKIKEGITRTIAHGIRVSANMVISNLNEDDVYETARLCSQLGVQKFFGTRLVPSVREHEPDEHELQLNMESARSALDQMLKAKHDFGIQVGTLISYPLCFLGDLEKYSDFVGRGCPAQSGARMVVNANGESHACTHEEEGYGSVFDEGIRPLFAKMNSWHNGSYLYEGCSNCDYVDICNSGCRMAGHAYFKNMDARDPLWVGHEHIGTPYRVEIPSEILEAVDSQKEFIVPPRIRFREERGFYTINIRWANAFSIETPLAKFLIEKQASSQPFTLADVTASLDDGRDSMIYLIFKDALEAVDNALQEHLVSRPKFGCSINPFELPEAVQPIE